MQITIKPASYDLAAYTLFSKYQRVVHDDPTTPEGYRRFLVQNPFFGDSEIGGVHAHYLLDGKLIAVAVLDILPACVSSVYFFYDPDYHFLTLGVFSALWEIEYCRTLQLPYYYMGFYIHQCEKMKYKVGHFDLSACLQRDD